MAHSTAASIMHFSVTFFFENIFLLIKASRNKKLEFLVIKNQIISFRVSTGVGVVFMAELIFNDGKRDQSF